MSSSFGSLVSVGLHDFIRYSFRDSILLHNGTGIGTTNGIVSGTGTTSSSTIEEIYN